MHKKYIAGSIWLIVIGLFIAQFIATKHNKSATLILNKNDVQRIHISYSMPIFHEFDITDTKQVYRIVDYINSLNKIDTKKNPIVYNAPR